MNSTHIDTQGSDEYRDDMFKLVPRWKSRKIVLGNYGDKL
jgi:hypothetical protein